MEITNKEIAWFWIEWFIVQVGYFIVIITGLFFAPIAYLLRYALKWKQNPLSLYLNDETDFGEDWWLMRERLEPGLWSAVRWWLRNPAWSFIKSIEIPTHREIYDIRTIKRTITTGHKLTNANRDKGIYGVNHVYYRLNDGKVYGRYSRANKKRELMLGVGNRRYVLRVKI